MADTDEFALLPDNAAEVGLPFEGRPAVRRENVPVLGGHALISALVWGTKPPELILLHGGGQNAHTWDTVALALDRPLVAIDLPGHGHSSWRSDGRYDPEENVAAVIEAIEELALGAKALVGMSLGGLTAIAITGRAPALASRLVLVDITPGVSGDRAKDIIAFIHGPKTFETREEIVERAVAFNPTRSRSSLERGVIHNTRQDADGRWMWRHHLGSMDAPADAERRTDFAGLWDAVGRYRGPLLLTRGANSKIVGDDDVAELQRRRDEAGGSTEVVTVADAGHSIQGDQPLELARLIAEFVR